MKSLPEKAKIIHEFWSEHVPLVSYSIVILYKQKIYSGCGTSACNPIDEFDITEGKRIARERAIKQIAYGITEDRFGWDGMPHHWQLRHESIGTEETIKVRVTA